MDLCYGWQESAKDLWVPAANCTKCRAGTAKFDISQSCNAVQVGNRITFRYGDGTVATGGSFYDAVKIGDLEVAKQLLIQVDTMESDSDREEEFFSVVAYEV